tara:strand:+ start:640 stop:1206 length:567 start_codon:yes stop_codon:yes gene_type:complete
MPPDPLQILQEVGAILEGHFVLTSGRHTDQYVNKDDLYPHTDPTSELCHRIAVFSDDGVQTVVAPEKGGIILSQWVAHHLTNQLGREVLAVYAEKAPGGGFAFGRRYDRLVAGKRVLVAEDVITTGDSVQAVIDAVKDLRGTIVGVGVLCNRSGMDSTGPCQATQRALGPRPYHPSHDFLGRRGMPSL